MVKWTRRDWTAVFAVPVVAAIVVGILMHVWTKPDPASMVVSQWKWSFGETLPWFLPTLIGMSFVYHLAVLPFVSSRTRRSAVFLTSFAGPTLAIGVFMVGTGVFLVLAPEAIGHSWERLVDVFKYSSTAIHEIEGIMAFGILLLMSVSFVAAAAMFSIRRSKEEPHPTAPQGGRRALLGLLLMTVLSAPLWTLMGWDWRRGSDRAGCIMNIRNVQQAMRSYMGMNGHSPGDRLSFSKETIVGPNNFVESEPVCPAGGTYWWVEDRHPYVGELMLRCSCPDHRPVNHQDW